MKKVLFSLSAIILLVTACKKDNESEAVTPTKENLTGSYMLTKVTAKAGNVEQDYTTTFYPEPCDRGDVYKLNADLSYQVVDAGAKCGNDYTDTWSFTNASTIVIDDVTYTIRKFDGKSLELVMDMGSGSFVRYYTKQ